MEQLTNREHFAEKPVPPRPFKVGYEVEVIGADGNGETVWGDGRVTPRGTVVETGYRESQCGSIRVLLVSGRYWLSPPSSLRLYVPPVIKKTFEDAGWPTVTPRLFETAITEARRIEYLALEMLPKLAAVIEIALAEKSLFCPSPDKCDCSASKAIKVLAELKSKLEGREMSKGLLDGWTFRVVETSGGEFFAWVDGPGNDHDSWFTPSIGGPTRVTKLEAEADLALLKCMVEAMEIVRRGAPGMEEMRDLLVEASVSLNTRGGLLRAERIERLVARYDAAVNAGKGE